MQKTMQAPEREAGEQDDAALVRLARSDDSSREKACLELYERYKDEVFSFLLRLVGERELALDTSQEAFFRLYRFLDRFDPERPFRPWLHQIVRNAALDALRLRRKEKHMLADAPPAEARGENGGVVGEVAGREEIADARRAIDALPEETRALLLQRHGLGMKLEDLAASFSCTERTVRNRLHMAASELAHVLREIRSRKRGRS
ncbi:RNA polymerase sigma factor [bacterium]|nr:RNA polymerase sigma factor [bacterium]